MTEAAAFYAAIDGTWPAAEVSEAGHWVLRLGGGGGKRVSAATALRPVTSGDIAQAEVSMTDMGQDPLFMITKGQKALDRALDARGYSIIDPVQVYACPVSTLAIVPIPPVTAFALWEPLAIMKEIWAAGGIGPARFAVMERAQTKTAVFARWKDKPAGVGFAAVHEGIAMVHAVEVLAHQRRQGVAKWIMRKAAFWAREQGAHTMAVLCVKENLAANTLYQRLGFSPVCEYHYRIRP